MREENAINFQCPRCGETLQAPPVWWGEVTTCPACNNPVVVPEGEQGDSDPMANGGS